MNKQRFRQFGFLDKHVTRMTCARKTNLFVGCYLNQPLWGIIDPAYGTIEAKRTEPHLTERERIDRFFQ